MAILDYAIAHARRGFPIFPALADQKIPAIKNPYQQATTDERTILRWWKETPQANICLPCGTEIIHGKFIGVIDVDNKKFNGYQTLQALELMGYEFPETLEQLTPSGGLHKIYYFDQPIGNGVNFLGPGIDHRGYHGYILLAGSIYHGKEYVFKNELQIAQAQEWFAGRLHRARSEGIGGSERQRSLPNVYDINASISERRATEYLAAQSPASEGERNHKGFIATCKLKDFGVTRERAFELMSTTWRCEPILEPEELRTLVFSAFKTGQNAPGIDSPEAAFEKVLPPPKEQGPKNPLETLNDQFAFATAGGGSQILWFTTDENNKECTDHLGVQAFKEKLSNQTYMPDGGKNVPLAKAWMEWPGRRTYDGVIFKPNFDNLRFYNKWQGFTCEPLEEAPTPKALKALANFKEHIISNVALGNEAHANWIFCWLAHIVQKPEEKPRTALVLRGEKGVGKSVIFDVLRRIVGKHFCSVANRRYLSGNFNGHLEDKLVYVLEEAYWSGQKEIDGVLKDLITNKRHMIERKGREVYEVDNLARVVILGNDEWVVPATEDERRYAVFEVSTAKQRDDNFFGAMVEDMDPRLLMKFLKEFDLEKADINQIPATEALARQKEQTMSPFKKWWLESLQAGILLGGQEVWPTELSREAFRAAFLAEMKAQGITRFIPSPEAIGRILKKFAPSCKPSRKARDGQRVYVYEFPTLEQARLDWEKCFGQKVYWPKDEDDASS